MSARFEYLFQPLKLRTFELPNRIVMPPMAIYIPGSKGYTQDRLVDYYEARARGGVGFIIVNATYVHPNGASHPNQTAITDDKYIPGLRNLAGAIQKHGVKASIQLYHAGRQRYALIAGGETLSPSGISDPVRKDPARAPTIDEIHGLVEDYGQAARRAKEAGFDAIEIHCAHGYLLSGFLSPYQNKRTDEYGGDVQGRTRIVREILSRCREYVGEDMLIGVRINGHDYVNGGNTLDDAKEIAKILSTAGAEVIHLSAGMAPSAQYSFLPAGIDQGYNVYLAEGIKSVVDVPVIACGAIEDPVYAESILSAGKADLVAIGRPLFADPQLPNKAREGRLDEIRPCLRCAKGAAVWPENMRCTVNPAVGQEKLFEEKMVPADAIKDVLIIGAGPAGLEAARISANRGHKVTVVEKTNQVGGKILLAKIPEYKRNQGLWLTYYENEMRRLGVTIKLNTELSVEDVENLGPDVIFVATGGKPLIPSSITGSDLPGVVTAEDALAGLIEVGKKTAVIGGSSMGVETAESILQRPDREVLVVEMLPKILSDISHDAELVLLNKLADKNFRYLDSTAVRAIVANDGKLDLVVQRYAQDMNLRAFDTVVMAVGVVSENTFGLELSKKRKNVYLIGDCESPGDYRKAIHDAAEVAISI